MSHARDVASLVKFLTDDYTLSSEFVDSDIISSSTINLSSNRGLGTKGYATPNDLPAGATAGSQAYVQSNNRLYISNGSGWYNVALINQAPYWITQPNGTYTLDKTGVATTITILGGDSDGHDVPRYTATGDSGFNAIATVTKDSDNGRIFYITGKDSENSASPTGGSGVLTFTLSDGKQSVLANSTFSIDFGPSGGAALFYVEGEGSSDKFGMTGQGGSTNFFSSLDISSGHFIIGAPSYNSSYGKAYLYSYTSSGSTAIRTHTQTYYSFLGQQVAVNTTAGKYAIGEQGSGGTAQGKLSVYNISDGSLAWDHTYAELSSPTTGEWPGTWSDIQMTQSNLYIAQSIFNSGALRSFSLSSGTQNWVVTSPTGTFNSDISVDESISRLIISNEGDGNLNRGKARIYNTTDGSLVNTMEPETSV